MDDFEELNLIKFLDGFVEAESFPSDIEEQSPPDFEINPLNRIGLLYKPVVDLVKTQKGSSRPKWPNNADFAVCLTHDVDHLGRGHAKYGVRKHLRFAKYQYRMLRHSEPSLIPSDIFPILQSLLRATTEVGKTMVNEQPDAFCQIGKLIHLEQSFDVRSTLFVLPKPGGDPHYSDPPYRLSDKVLFKGKLRTISSIFRNMRAEGFEIGLHGTWYTFNDSNALLKEKKYLENYIGNNITSVRHHWLHYDPRITPSVQDDAGLKFDSTIGFNKNIGFRRGTCFPWRKRDLQTGKMTDVYEIPLIIQDTALLSESGLSLPHEMAFDYVQTITESVRKVGGILTLLWHPSHFNTSQDWQLYEAIINYLVEQNAYFGTISEIGNYWIAQNGDKLI